MSSLKKQSNTLTIFKIALLNTPNLNIFFLNGNIFLEQLAHFPVVEFGQHHYFNADASYEFRSSPQPVFNKQFDLLIEDLEDAHDKGYQNFILCNGKEQINRFESILEDYDKDVHFKPILLSLSQAL